MRITTKRHDVGVESRRCDFQALNSGEHRERGRDHGVAVKQTGADDAEQRDRTDVLADRALRNAISVSVPPSPWLSARSRISTYGV
jgi:hypothetical protein